jgi:hypothetical protein
VFNFQIEAWAAIAPGLESQGDWQRWLQKPDVIDEPMGKVSLNQFPAMLRRRFGALGKCAMGAALPIVEPDEAIPSIFASRYGDMALTLTLLEDIARNEPMSPTGFSLAVHNAVSGLFTIGRNDTSAVTSIAAMEGLMLQTLFEAIGQLQNVNKVLCVVYDVPLPDFFQHYSCGELFPYALAFVVCNAGGDAYRLEQCANAVSGPVPTVDRIMNVDTLNFLKLINGLSTNISLGVNGSTWQITKTET